MVLKAILVGLVAGYGRIEQSWFGQQMIARPIWLCTLVGLVLGDLNTGVIIGGTLELIWAGVVQVGATPTEVVSGSVLAAALCIESGLTVEEAVVIAIPVATLASVMGTMITSLNTLLWSPITNKAVDDGNSKLIWFTGIAGGLVYFVVYFLIISLGFVAGSAAIQAFIDKIPMLVRDGLTYASKLLPAIGVAILMKFTFDWKFAGFFALGFILAAYFGLGSMALALIGGTCAFIYYQLKPNKVAEED
ncbi:PTS system mannose-specific EIIC component [bioreactor metagenome]|uniref:PTS system mannose-specific EIIC component n=1 Tax=bioreactor metagenome TaxID=1076179 RepID=A0A645CTJ4_9ZZZZ